MRALLLLVLTGCVVEAAPAPRHFVLVELDAQCPNAGGAYEGDGRAIEQEAGPGCEER